jgi:hypothetical protein
MTDRSADQRREFEQWAAEAYGGDISKFTCRAQEYPDEYVAADLEWAWRAWQARGRCQMLEEENRELRHIAKILGHELNRLNDTASKDLQDYQRILGILAAAQDMLASKGRKVGA